MLRSNPVTNTPLSGLESADAAVPARSLSREDLLPNSIHFSQVSTAQLIKVFERFDLPVGADVIADFNRLVQHKNAALNASSLFDGQINGCLARIRDRQIHEVGETHYQIRREIDITGVSAHSYLIFTLESPEAKDGLPNLRVQFFHDRMSRDEIRNIWNIAESIGNDFDAAPLASEIIGSFDESRESIFGMPMLETALSERCTATFISSQPEPIDEDTASSSQSIAYNSIRPVGAIISDPTSQTIHLLARQLCDQFALINEALGEDSVFEKASAFIREDIQFQADIWELRGISPRLSISIDRCFEIGVLDQEDFAAIPAREETGSTVVVKQISPQGASAALELFLDDAVVEMVDDDDDIQDAPDSDSHIEQVLTAKLIFDKAMGREELWEFLTPIIREYFVNEFDPADEQIISTGFETLYFLGRAEIMVQQVPDRFFDN